MKVYSLDWSRMIRIRKTGRQRTGRDIEHSDSNLKGYDVTKWSDLDNVRYFYNFFKKHEDVPLALSGVNLIG